MSALDLNTAATGGDLIPDGTVVRAVLTIRPGGSGDGGWLKMSKSGGLMIDTEWTITEGPNAKRKVWRYMSLSENAAPITMRQLRAVVEGHHGILPSDMSEAAVAKRKVGFSDLNGMEACIMVGIEPAQDGYEAKNTVKAVLPPGDTKYVAKGAGGAAPAGQPAGSVQLTGGFMSGPTAGGGNKPAWA